MTHRSLDGRLASHRLALVLKQAIVTVLACAWAIRLRCSAGPLAVLKVAADPDDITVEVEGA